MFKHVVGYVCIALFVVSVAGETSSSQAHAWRAFMPPKTTQLRGAMTPETTAPGIRGSWSQKGIDYAREVAIEIFSQRFSSITLPTMNFDKDSFSGSVSNFKCSDLKIVSSKSTLVAGKGVTLGIDVSISCSADWSYRENVWPHIPHGSGSVTASTSGSSVSATIGITAVDLKPHVSALSCSSNININSMHFHGGLSGDILNLFKHLIESHVNSAMDSTICSKFSGIINDEMNQVLDSFTYELMLDLPGVFNISSAKFGIMDTTIESAYVGVDLQGEVVNRAHPTNPPFAPNPLPAFSADDATHMLQLYISRYVFDSGAWVFFQAGLERLVITPQMVPKSVPVQLNTSSPTFKSIAPGMAEKYPDMGIDIVLQASAAPSVNGNTSVANLTAPIFITFCPVTASGPADAFQLGCKVQGGLSANVTNQRIVGQLTELQCNLSLVNSTVGTVHVTALAEIVSYLLNDAVLPQANKLLATGFPIPTLADVKFVNSILKFGDGYVELATDLEYSPPKV